jgi:hypothetical protein
MPKPLQKYYDILGVNSTTRLPQLKAAYRRKAKLLHPDINTSPDSNAKFILLNEAYRCLTEQHHSRPFYEREKAPAPKQRSTDERRMRMENARKQTEQRERRKAESFRRSRFYFAVVALHALMDYMILIGVGCAYFVVLFFGTVYQGIPGMIAGILTVLITIPTAVTGFLNFKKERVR